MDAQHRVERRVVVLGLAASAASLAACSTPPANAPDASMSASTETSAGRRPPPGPAVEEPTSSPTTGSGSPPPVPAVLATDGPDIAHGPVDRQTVGLTFHGAGDIALAGQVLDLAASAGARITVFAVGQWLAANPDIGRRIVGQGHDLGNHTWSHPALPSLGAAETSQEVARGAAAVAASVGGAGVLFRPSGTQGSTPVIRAAARAAGYHRCVSYDVDPMDYLDPGPQLVASRTLAGVSAGSIVSLHLGHPGTVAALPAIFAGLSSRSLRPVRLTDLLAGT